MYREAVELGCEYQQLRKHRDAVELARLLYKSHGWRFYRSFGTENLYQYVRMHRERVELGRRGRGGTLKKHPGKSRKPKTCYTRHGTTILLPTCFFSFIFYKPTFLLCFPHVCPVFLLRFKNCRILASEIIRLYAVIYVAPCSNTAAEYGLNTAGKCTQIIAQCVVVFICPWNTQEIHGVLYPVICHRTIYSQLFWIYIGITTDVR
jgi:hypothetical protein